MRKRNLVVILLILAGVCLAAKAQCPQFELGLQVGTVANNLLDEISGIAASRKNTDVFWVHNDRGGQARVWALNSEGTHLGIYHLSGANNRDWEDITIGPGPVDGVDYLYVGNIGDGGAPNPYVTVYRVAEPTVDSEQSPVETTLTGVEAINLEYPDGDQYRDAETLMLDPVTKDIYIISKEDVPPRVYRAPYPQSTTTTTMMEHVCVLPSPWYETSGGDISLDGSMIIVRDDDHHASIWLRPEGTNLWEAFSDTECSVELPSPSEINGESICFDAEGNGYYTTTERESGPKPPIYYFASVGEGFPGTIYVDADATGANDGSSWADAFNYLQGALSAAQSGDEIWVAEGTYTPDSSAADPNGSGDREAAFQLINGVAIKGGYAGVDEPDPDARDIEVYETILNGDLDGNDVDVNNADDLFEEPTRAENSYHVVTGSNIDANVVLDGFTITAGNANNGDLYSRHQFGGGMNNYKSSPTVINCTFERNAAGAGGGMYNVDSNPTLRNCSFIGNSAHKVLHYGGSGGGIYTFSDSRVSHVEVANCVFEGNSALSGGGISSGSQLVVTDCMFKKNRGGGIRGAATELKGCTFTSNQDYGIFIGSDSHLTNCLFTGNIGCGLRAQDCDIVVTNCTFVGNIAYWAAGIWNDEGDTTVTNCISWGNIARTGSTESAQIATEDPAVINYCCIQGWSGALGGTGNTGADPCFVELGYWGPLPDYNDDYWARHIRWSGGDYHLKSQGGRWEPSSQNWIKDNVTSPCIDAGDMASPIGLEPFPNGGIINMGAYGGTSEASKSYFGEPVCETIVAGDINGDCRVDFKDFAFMAFHWLENNSP